MSPRTSLVTGRLADSVRRLADITVAILGLMVAAPVMATVALAVRCALGPGVIYHQRRLGLAGRPFSLLKFRTMARPSPGRENPEFDAERLGRLGRSLRSTSLDELPSLWNLLRGEITLVGPRPLPVHYWDRYRGQEYCRFEVKPGITGLAQVTNRNRLGWEDRLALDAQYVRTRTLAGDLRILLRTVPVVLARTGVDQEGGVTMHELPAHRPPTPGG